MAFFAWCAIAGVLASTACTKTDTLSVGTPAALKAFATSTGSGVLAATTLSGSQTDSKNKDLNEKCCILELKHSKAYYGYKTTHFNSWLR